MKLGGYFDCGFRIIGRIVVRQPVVAQVPEQQEEHRNQQYGQGHSATCRRAHVSNRVFGVRHVGFPNRVSLHFPYGQVAPESPEPP